MVLYGTTHRVGDGITTTDIIAPEHRSDDPAQLAAFCFAAVDAALAECVAEGDLLLAGEWFGQGESPDEAVLALQALGFAAVIARSAASTFVEAAEVAGLPVILVPEVAAEVAPGTVLRLDLERGTLAARSTGQKFTFPPSSPALLAALRRTRLLANMRRMVEEEGFEG